MSGPIYDRGRRCYAYLPRTESFIDGCVQDNPAAIVPPESLSGTALVGHRGPKGSVLTPAESNGRVFTLSDPAGTGKITITPLQVLKASRKASS